MSHGIKLSKSQCPTMKDKRENMDKIPYASAIGSIMYVMLCTRPDVSYALSMTSRFQLDPGECHWIAVKNILKYLRRTKNIFSYLWWIRRRASYKWLYRCWFSV